MKRIRKKTVKERPPEPVHYDRISPLVLLPKPVLIEILTFKIDSFNELMHAALTCKRIQESIMNSDYIWFSLSLHSYKQAISNMFSLEKAVSDFKNGVSPTHDWRGFYMEERDAEIERARVQYQRYLKSLVSLNYTADVRRGIESLNLNIVWEKNKHVMEIKRKDIFYLATGMSVRVIPDIQTNSIGQLALIHENQKYIIYSSQFADHLEGKDISLHKTENTLSVKYSSGEICVICWTIHYLDIISFIKEYRMPPPQFRYRSQTETFDFVLDLRTGGTHLYNCTVPALVFNRSGNRAFAEISKINAKVPKSKLFFAWRTLVFSGKFQNVAVIDCSLKNSQGMPVWWVSQAANLAVCDMDIDGEIMGATYAKNAGEVTLLFKEKAENWLLTSIRVSLQL